MARKRQRKPQTKIEPVSRSLLDAIRAWSYLARDHADAFTLLSVSLMTMVLAELEKRVG